MSGSFLILVKRAGICFLFRPPSFLPLRLLLHFPPAQAPVVYTFHLQKRICVTVDKKRGRCE